MPFLLQNRTGNSVTYVNPDTPNRTFRLKQTSVQKNLDGLPFKNHRTEIVYLDTNELTVGSETVRDPVSVRLTVSGAAESEVLLRTMVQLIGNTAESWLLHDEHVLAGFEPTVAPHQNVQTPA